VVVYAYAVATGAATLGDAQHTRYPETCLAPNSSAQDAPHSPENRLLTLAMKAIVCSNRAHERMEHTMTATATALPAIALPRQAPAPRA
jgi:hypothetical protein